MTQFQQPQYAPQAPAPAQPQYAPQAPAPAPQQFAQPPQQLAPNDLFSSPAAASVMAAVGAATGIGSQYDSVLFRERDGHYFVRITSLLGKKGAQPPHPVFAQFEMLIIRSEQTDARYAPIPVGEKGAMQYYLNEYFGDNMSTVLGMCLDKKPLEIDEGTIRQCSDPIVQPLVGTILEVVVRSNIGKTSGKPYPVLEPVRRITASEAQSLFTPDEMALAFLPGELEQHLAIEAQSAPAPAPAPAPQVNPNNII